VEGVDNEGGCVPQSQKPRTKEVLFSLPTLKMNKINSSILG
jgi:hypothetical protein